MRSRIADTGRNHDHELVDLEFSGDTEPGRHLGGSGAERNYTAQYGAYMGIHINSDTKSGTNALHGTAYDYIQNDIFNAKPWLYCRLRTPKMRFNQFGGVLSGPVVIPFLYNGRDKTFFMGSYEGLRPYSTEFTSDIRNGSDTANA